MDETTTAHLADILNHIGSEQELTQYLDQPKISDGFTSFAGYYQSLPEVKALDSAALITGSGIERSYFYQIMNGRKAHPGRDKILALCLAAHLDQNQTRRALELGGEAPLYARNRRDAIISFAIGQKLGVQDTNLLLDRFQEVPVY